MKEKGFKDLVRVDEAREEFFSPVEPLDRTEELPLPEADGRVSAADVLAPRPAPHYRRAAMDGFAVRAADTFGASQSSPNRLKVSESVREGAAVPVHTGGHVPDEADAVLKIEDTRRGDDRLDVYSSIAPGDNVSPVGEDVEKGDVLLEKGTRIQPSSLGLLRSLGLETLNLVARPEVTVVPTGEELVSPGEEPGPGETVQSNGVMISSCVRRWGGEPKEREVLSDRPEDLRTALNAGVDESDAVAFTGGSSVGRRDRIVKVLEEEGEVLVHGVAVQPGKPVALALVEWTPVIALPGYPVAALADAYFFLEPLIQHLTGAKSEDKTATVRLTRKISSKLGRLSLVRVRVEEGEAHPIRVAGSGVLSSVTRSDGFVLVPEDSEGVAVGEEVELHHWR
ncbi:molybdopterin molybdotransferase MoeA [Candidatus Bipolaricaulota bacterium]|nr:molybdopterin molybdotransferase MoeA [Candidatus Bipolaricaulota bacterium]